MRKSAKKTLTAEELAAKTLTKRDVVIKVAAETKGVTQTDVYNVLQATLSCIVEAVKLGRHVEFRDFGVFEVVTRKPRIGRNPNQPEKTVMIPARKVVKFKPGKEMRTALKA